MLRQIKNIIGYLAKKIGILNGISLQESSFENSTISKKAKINLPLIFVDSELGDYSYIAKNSCVSYTSIGKFCSLGPGLLCGWGIHPITGVSTSPMFYSTKKQNGVTLSQSDKIEERKRIIIGNDVFIGANVTILDGVTIGNGAVIGASSLVNKDVPPYAIVGGVPAKIIRYRFTELQIQELLQIQWWDFSNEQLKLVEQNFFDIDEFIATCKKQIK